MTNIPDERIAQELREHVNSRGGPGKDENRQIVLRNGAWAMMLQAADYIDKLAKRPQAAPLIHEEGTPIEVLKSEYVSALQALSDAIESVQSLTVDPRDFYPKQDNDFGMAFGEKEYRISRLRVVRDEVQNVFDQIAAQAKLGGASDREF